MTLLYSLLSSWVAQVCEGGELFGDGAWGVNSSCICEIHVHACHLVACVPDAEPGAAADLALVTKNLCDSVTIGRASHCACLGACWQIR